MGIKRIVETAIYRWEIFRDQHPPQSNCKVTDLGLSILQNRNVEKHTLHKVIITVANKTFSTLAYVIHKVARINLYFSYHKLLEEIAIQRFEEACQRNTVKELPAALAILVMNLPQPQLKTFCENLKWKDYSENIRNAILDQFWHYDETNENLYQAFTALLQKTEGAYLTTWANARQWHVLELAQKLGRFSETSLFKAILHSKPIQDESLENKVVLIKDYYITFRKGYGSWTDAHFKAFCATDKLLRHLSTEEEDKYYSLLTSWFSYFEDLKDERKLEKKELIHLMLDVYKSNNDLDKIVIPLLKAAKELRTQFSFSWLAAENGKFGDLVGTDYIKELIEFLKSPLWTEEETQKQMRLFTEYAQDNRDNMVLEVIQKLS